VSVRDHGALVAAMTAVRRELRGLVADKLRYWALRLEVWALRLDPDESRKVFVAMAYVDYEGGALCGVYSSREAAEAAATLIPYADDRIVHEVTIDAAPLERSP